MRRVGHLLTRYPWVSVAVAMGITGLALLTTPFEFVVPWLVGGFAGLVGLVEGTRMVRALIARHVGLDILAVTAIAATLAVGEYWASLIIVIMLTGGEALEDAAAHRAKRQLTHLLDRVPHTAHVVNPDGSLRDVWIHDVAPGDRLLVRPSEIVPVDATLDSPHGDFDESSLTGESLPVERVAGDVVLSGSVNGERAVHLVAVKYAKDSEYQAIVALVQQAASSKAPLVRLADRYAVPFTALAYAIAGLAWWLSGDAVRFAEVLVVATPCPLLIAAPVAFMGGMSQAATRGIVIKDAGTLERLSRVTTVALDKTGTLTRGTPEVVRVEVAGSDFPTDYLLALVASIEQYSTHVLAQAIVSYAKDQALSLLETKQVTEVATDGVRGMVDSREVFVGKARFVAEHTTAVPPAELGSGETAVFVGVDRQYAGYLVLRDSLRPEALRTIKRLRDSGISRLVMVTGDNRHTAENIAHSVGISEVYAECLPSDKVNTISSFDAPTVMMVGDGVNDAPVLAASGVGVAMGARGSTAASESADVVIVLDNLERVADAFDIGKRTVTVALQSIWLGIVISVALMIVAAFGFLPAIYGALAQELVDIIAIVGALRALTPTRRRKQVAPQGEGPRHLVADKTVGHDFPAT